MIKFKNNIFMRYLFSYIIILAIPLLVLGYITRIYFINFYSDEILHQNMDSLNKMNTSIEKEVTQFNNIAIQVGMNKEFSSTYISENVSAFYDIQQKLSEYKLTNNFIYDILLYNRNYSLLNSAGVTYNPYILFGSIYKYKDKNWKYYKELLDNEKSPKWLPVENVQINSGSYIPIITYIEPVVYGPYSKDSVIMFMIDANSFYQMLINPSDKNYFYNLMIDDKKNIIYSSASERSIDIEDNMIKAAQSFPAGVWGKYTIGKDEMYISSIKSDITGLTFISALPINIMLRDVASLQSKFLIGIFIIIIIGAALIYLLTRYNYEPIKQLGQFAKSLVIDVPTDLNEIEAAEQAITSISKTSRESQKEHMLLRLLKGEYSDVTIFNRDSINAGLYLSGPNFRVIILNIDDDTPQDSLKNASQIIEKAMTSEFETYMVEYIEQNSFIMIFSEGQFDIEFFESKLSLIQNHLLQVSKINSTIGVGNSYPSLQSIVKSYQEAKTASKYRLVKGSNSIIFYSNLSQKETSNYSYPKDELMALYNSIKDGNANQIEFIIEELIPHIKKRNHNLFLAVCLCYDIVNTALKAMYELNGSLTNFNERYPEIMSKSEFHSVKELIDIVRKLCSEIIEYISSISSTKKDATMNMDDAIPYIKEHFCSPTFSIKWLADYLGMSVSNFSHRFKNIAGQNVSDYISNLRITKAKDLLKTTNISVNDIVQQIGYVQPSSFIHKFKQLEGITPGEYRLKCQKQSLL